MKKAKWLTLVAGALVTVVAVAVVAGCGSSSSSSSSSPSAAASMTPTQAFTKILGHAPTGMAATIATKGSFVVVDDANYPPQSYIDKNGNLIGFDVDVAKRLSTILGVPAKIVNAPWASVLSGIPVGRFDVSIGSMTITSDRAKSMAFSVPYYYTQAQVIVKQGSPILANAAALKGKTIGVGTGTTYAQYLDKLKGVKVKAYDTDASTFPDLRNGRLNGVMTADLTAAQAISSGYPFVFSGNPYYYEPLAFSTEKGQADWLALLNYAVNKMHQDGSLTAMAKKWYHGFDPTQMPHTGTPSFEQALAAAP
jgi:polar amino acid transport system substrate-binding protein